MKILSLSFVLVLACLSVQADPIVVNGVISQTITGSVGTSSGLRTTAGLTGINFSANVNSVGGGGVSGLHNCTPLFGMGCMGGNFNSSVSGSSLAGTFTVNGASYQASGEQVLWLEIAGSSFTIAPELIGSTVEINSTFTFTGGTSTRVIGENTMLQPLSGFGNVRLVLSPNQFNSFYLQSATYTFTSHVPEPASMLLICSGLVGIAVKLRRRI